MCDMSHLHVWHVSNSFVCMCNGCHVCRCLCVVMSVFVSRVGRSHMVHAYVCHDLFARVICHVRMCECSLAIRWGQLCCNVLLLNTCRWTIVQQIPAWKSTLRKYLFQYIFSRRSSCNQEQSWFSTATLARPYVTHCNTLQHTLCNTLQHTLPSTDGDRHTSQTTLCFSVFWVKVWNGPETFDGQNRFGGCSRVVLCFQCVGGVMRILSGLNMTNLSVSRTLLSVYCEFWWRALSVPESTWLICLYQNFMIYILLWFLLSAYYCYLYYLCAQSVPKLRWLVDLHITDSIIEISMMQLTMQTRHPKSNSQTLHSTPYTLNSIIEILRIWWYIPQSSSIMIRMTHDYTWDMTRGCM